MTPRTRSALIATGSLLYLMSCILFYLWLINTVPRPYERPPQRTVEEQRKVERATYKIGRHYIIDGEREIIIVMENGGKRIIKRG